MKIITQRKNQCPVLLLCLSIGLMVSVPLAEANVDEVKIYKKAFPGSKPKCMICHLDKIPKKEDGKHDLNAYGLKVKELGEEATVEALQALGTAEDFNYENMGDDVQDMMVTDEAGDPEEMQETMQEEPQEPMKEE